MLVQGRDHNVETGREAVWFVVLVEEEWLIEILGRMRTNT